MCEAVGVRFVRVFYKGIVLSEMEWVQLNEFVGRLRALAPDFFFFFESTRARSLFEQCMGD